MKLQKIGSKGGSIQSDAEQACADAREDTCS